MIYATRLNSLKSRPELYFESGTVGTLDLLRRAGEIEGLGALSLNYPEHFTAVSPREVLSVLETTHLGVDSLNIRFPEDPFGTGGFTNASAHVRAAAVDLTRRAVDVCAELGGDHVIVWPAYDGFDYPFQDSYRRMFEHTVEGFAAVAAHDPQTRVGIEYKPWEPRKQSMLANMGEALLVVAQVDAPNLGVVMDYCHAQMANEHPPKAAALALAQDRLFGVHLNDGYGRQDDGLMVGTSSLITTVELLTGMLEGDYRGTIYFDTFPVLEDPRARVRMEHPRQRAAAGDRQGARLDRDGVAARRLQRHPRDRADPRTRAHAVTDVVVVGSIHIDRIMRVDRLPAPGETGVAIEAWTQIGGKAANQAIASAHARADGARGLRRGRHGRPAGARGPPARRSRTPASARAGGMSPAAARRSSTPVARISPSSRRRPTRRCRAPTSVAAIEELEPTVVLCQWESPLETVRAALATARAAGCATLLNAAPWLEAHRPRPAPRGSRRRQRRRSRRVGRFAARRVSGARTVRTSQRHRHPRSRGRRPLPRRPPRPAPARSARRGAVDPRRGGSLRRCARGRPRARPTARGDAPGGQRRRRGVGAVAAQGRPAHPRPRLTPLMFLPRHPRALT